MNSKANLIKKCITLPVKLNQITALLILFSCAPQNSGTHRKKIADIDEYRRLRLEKLNEPRPVIHNNDGCDAYLFPADREFSIPNFLDIRTAGLKGTDVSTISYCSITSSFGQFTHRTKVGEFLTIQHQRPGKKNVIPEFDKLETDPLEVTCKYARENGFEFFWSNRINDTHDAEHRPDKPYERWSKLKTEHPEYLFGSCGEKLPYGRWSAVDFSRQEIRDLCVKYYTEVCENYDVDGIELDFFRHLYLFRNVAHGETATPEQLEMLNDMVSRIREMTEKVGIKKGKPILVLVRIPDSVEYCRSVGIDIEKWMGSGWVDIVVGSDYFRLNPWKYLVELGHKHQVKIYAGLSEPRVKDENRLLVRLQNPVYRARSAAAWQAGVDGLYIFNEYDTRSRYLSEIGNAGKLKNKNNLYFATYLNANPEAYLKDGSRFQSLPVLTPTTPMVVGPVPLEILFELGDESMASRIALILCTETKNRVSLSASFNRTELKYLKSAGEGLTVYTIPPECVKPGENIIKIACGPGKVTQLYDAAVLFFRDPGDPDLNELAKNCFDL